MRKLAFTAISALFALASISAHAQVTYSIANNGSYLLRDSAGLPLDNETPGDPANGTNGEGQLVQLGYFSDQNGDFSSALSGSFISLVSFASGDSGTGNVPVSDGRVSLSTNFNVGGTYTKFFGTANAETATTENPFPTSPFTVYLAVRWYDSLGNYNTAVSSDWTWLAPTGTSTPGPAISFQSAANLTLENGQNPNGGANLLATIPEPGIGSLAMAGLGVIITIVRRRKK